MAQITQCDRPNCEQILKGAAETRRIRYVGEMYDLCAQCTQEFAMWWKMLPPPRIEDEEDARRRVIFQTLRAHTDE